MYTHIYIYIHMYTLIYIYIYIEIHLYLILFDYFTMYLFLLLDFFIEMHACMYGDVFLPFWLPLLLVFVSPRLSFSNPRCSVKESCSSTEPGAVAPTTSVGGCDASRAPRSRWEPGKKPMAPFRGSAWWI